ncbi:transmembrane protein, putative (macronuclear) [Tetrahymena thermophila SB210]|uniref:Transmembrane protein, putative n=1 Tax=Tetrahymena thermophila (strain SB210) TaxID=312017 RepID=Q232M0_TETTS|nr:transmembrane protein, putative [Tetrahymena thermophila SB210]EAR91392.2 transmembrane protein, putative [Tetrahymena thermophila SB210]|eukprot:XP_001011637.2 transmembrane protein, putative [Tetrahymena thermophila SB210]
MITSKILGGQDTQLDEQQNQDDSIFLEAANIIAGMYQEAIRSKNAKDCLDEIDFSYLTFIATINKNPYASYLKITNAKTNPKLILGIKDQQKLLNIMKNDVSQQIKFQNSLEKNKHQFKLYDLLQLEEEIATKHQTGYCVPFQLKIQSQILDQDFGLSIWANPIKEDSIYLALDSENPNIIQMANKFFYKKFLKENHKISKINSIKTETLIPIIHHLIKQAQNSKEQKFQTVFVKPNQIQQQKYHLSDPNFLNNLKYAEIFSATIQELCNINLQLNTDFEEDYRNSIKSIIQIQQDDDFSNQNVSQIQIQNHLSLYNEKKSSTNIQLSTPTNLESQLQLNNKELSLNNENIKLKQNSSSSNQILLLSNSQRYDQDLLRLSTSRSKTQLIIQQESFDTFQQSYNKQVTLQDQQVFQSSIIKEQLVKLNLQKVNSSKNIISNNFNQQSSKLVIDCFTPRSSNRKLIQTTISSQQVIENGIQTNDQKYQNKKWLEEQEENKQLQNIDIQQLSSSSKSSKSKEIFENMHKKKQMWYLTVINILGIASILVTIALTLQGFFIFLTSLISQRENFKYINWIYTTNIEISYSISERNVFLLNRYNLMSTPPSQNQTFVNYILNSLQPRIKLSKEQVQLLYNNTDSKIQVFNIIQNKYIDQYIYSSPNVSQQVNLSILYSILIQLSNLYYFASNNDPTGMMKKQNEMNFQAINQQVQIIFSEMNDSYENQLTQIQNQSLLQLYIITLIMLTFLISKIPSFIYSKKKEQQILKLFATFDREQLREILTQIKNQFELYTFDQKANFSKFDFKFSHNQMLQKHSVEEKKLNISQTSTLQYSIKKLLIGLTVTFCLVIIYPILNYVIVRQFIDNSRVIYNFNNAVCVTYFIVQNSLRARHSLAMAYLVPFEQARPIPYYQDILQQLTPQIKDLPNLIKNNLEKVSSTNLYNKQIFEDYLVNVFTQNACDTIQEYTQYQNGNFIYNECTTSGKGSLKSGLLNGLMFFFNVYMDYTTFAFSPDVATFQKFYNNYHKNIPAYKQFQLKLEVSKYLEYLLNFFQEQNILLYDYYERQYYL